MIYIFGLMNKGICNILLILLCLPAAARHPAQGARLPQGPAPQIKLTVSPAGPAAWMRPDTVRVTIIGDVMMHAKQLQYDYTHFLDGIAPLLRSSDCSAANMEFALGGKPYSGYPAFSAPDGYAEYVAADCGVDVLLTANNHILDKGSAGLERTLRIYDALRDSLGVQHTGCTRSADRRRDAYPLVVPVKGIRIAFVNFTYGTNNRGTKAFPRANLMDRKEVGEAISRAREGGADFIVALPHWGEEYRLRHNASQREWAEWLVSQGADAVIGAHPHVVQDSCRIGSAPVIYSLGNAVSNMSAINTRIGLAVSIDFAVDPLSGERAITGVGMHFTWCCLPGTLTGGYRTVFVKESAGRRSEWARPSDYDEMMATYTRVKAATGIED